MKVGFVTDGLRDLDAIPPAIVKHDTRGDVWFNSDGTEGNTLYGVDGARLARWTDTTHLPSYAECRDLLQRTSVGELALGAHDVLCVKTSVGRTALLQVTGISEPAKQGNLPTFDVTVWEPVTQ